MLLIIPNNNNTQLVTRHMSMKTYYQIWRNWIAGADEEGCQRRYDILYKYVLSCFLKESNDKEKSVRWTGRAFHIEGTTWQKAWLAKTVLATSTWRRILELEQRDLDVVWKLSRSARYSGLFVVNVLKVWRAILNLIREATGSQCRSARHYLYLFCSFFIVNRIWMKTWDQIWRRKKSSDQLRMKT